MFTKNSLFGLIMALMVFLSSCGGGTYINNDYNPPADNDLTLSVMPVFEDMPVDVISIFEDVFQDPSAPYMVKNLPNKLYEQGPDSGMIDIMLKIASIDYGSGDLKKHPNLKDHISPEELLEFKDAIGEPDLLLVPTRFSLKEINFSVVGKTTIRLYDLDIGSLIFQNNENINIGRGGVVRSGGLLQAVGVGSKVSPQMIDVAENCTYLLASQAFKDINKQVFKTPE